jgi:hypothetical protein
MGVQNLVLEDSYGRKLHFKIFAGQVTVTPIVEKVGDEIALTDGQWHLLQLYLAEHVRPAPKFTAG